MRDNRKSIAINDAKLQRTKWLSHFINPAEKALHDKLVALVDNMLELQKKFHETRLERDKELYERQITIVDSQIDRQVYDLYGLTEEEVKVVDGEFKMSTLREKIFERKGEGILQPKTKHSKSFQ